MPAARDLVRDPEELAPMTGKVLPPKQTEVFVFEFFDFV